MRKIFTVTIEGNLGYKDVTDTTEIKAKDITAAKKKAAKMVDKLNQSHRGFYKCICVAEHQS